jgi:serine/threonine protein kinase
MEAIEYLHSKGVCHRDIKPSNILVTKDQHVYLADFNVSRKRTEETFRMMTKTGTLAFCAPEIFLQAYYDEKVDVWSAGAMWLVAF